MPSPMPPMRLVAEGGPYDGRVFELPPGESPSGAPSTTTWCSTIRRCRASTRALSRGRGRARGRGSRLARTAPSSTSARSAAAPCIRATRVRFGELGFRVEGDGCTARAPCRPSLPRSQFFALAGGARGDGRSLLVLMIVFLVRKPARCRRRARTRSRASRGRRTRTSRQGRTLIAERKYIEAKSELDQALELDPANPEARRLRNLAGARARGRAAGVRRRSCKIGASAIARRSTRRCTLYDDITDGTPAHARLQREAGRARWCSFGNAQCTAARVGRLRLGDLPRLRAWRRTESHARRRDGAHAARRRAASCATRAYVRCRAAP